MAHEWLEVAAREVNPQASKLPPSKLAKVLIGRRG
jgi:hypothetical protein